ncbi:hypothetical protein DFH28DRAFT_207571 [Melampsora americana]|nr:hypothetical protein DFH28DRAFT_207571 [Melampsora americana]
MNHIMTWTLLDVVFILSCNNFLSVLGFFSRNGVGRDLLNGEHINQDMQSPNQILGQAVAVGTGKDHHDFESNIWPLLQQWPHGSSHHNDFGLSQNFDDNLFTQGLEDLQHISRQGDTSRDAHTDIRVSPWNHPHGHNMPGIDRSLFDEEDKWITNLLELDYHDLLPLPEGVNGNEQEALDPKNVLEYHQIISPQFHQSMGHFENHTPSTHSIIAQGNPIEEYPMGALKMGGSMCFDNHARDLSTDDFPISDFEIFDAPVSQGSEVNWADKSSERVDANSQSGINTSRHSNPQEKFSPSLSGLSQIDYPTQENLFGSPNPFHTYNSFPQEEHLILLSDTPGHQTANNHVVCASIGLPLASDNPQATTNFDNQENASLGKENSINLTHERSSLDPEGTLINNPFNLWGDHTGNVMGWKFFPNYRQNFEERVLPPFKDDFNELHGLQVHNLIDQASSSRSILQSLETQSAQIPESATDFNDLWNSQKDKMPQSPLNAYNRLDQYQETIMKENSIWKMDSGLINSVLDKQRKSLDSRHGSQLASNSGPKQPHHKVDNTYVPIDVESDSSKDSPLSVPNKDTPISRFHKANFHHSNALKYRNNLKDTGDSTNKKVIEVIDIQDEDDMMPPKKKPHVESKTEIEKMKIRESFNRFTEITLDPFMIQLDQFLTREVIPRMKPKTSDSWANRFSVLTHEFLLLLLKAGAVYNYERKGFNSTLVEGYQWLLGVWRTIPVETSSLYECARTIMFQKAYSPDSIEYAISLRVVKSGFCDRSQNYFSAYVVLSWMKRFRPKWFKFFIKGSRLESEEIPEYESSHLLIERFRSDIQRRISSLEERVQAKRLQLAGNGRQT